MKRWIGLLILLMCASLTFAQDDAQTPSGLSIPGEFYAIENYAAYPPGTQRAYSNVAYGLAGYLVEVLAAEPLNRYSAEKIFQPLKMNSTGWMLSEIDRGQHARLYEWSDGKHTPVAWYGLATWPDGGVRTGVRDLGRFFAAMMNGGELDGIRILQEATVNAMFQPQFAAGQILEGIEEGENEKQAISWAYRTAPGGEVVAGHSGADPGVSTHAYFFPEIGRAAILLVNTSSENQTFQLAVRDMMRALLNAAMNNKDKK